MLHDESFITGFLIGDKKGYRRGFEEGGGGGGSDYDTIEKGLGAEVDIWTVPTFVEKYPDRGNQVHFGWRIWYIAAVLNAKYGFDMKGNTRRPGESVDTPPDTSRFYLWMNPMGGDDSDTIYLDLPVSRKSGFAVNNWNATMWLVVCGSAILIVTKYANYDIPCVIGGFVHLDDGWRPWYAPGLDENFSIIGGVGVGGDLGNPAVQITGPIFAEAQIATTYGRCNPFWYVTSAEMLQYTETQERMLPNFSSLGTPISYKGRSLLYLFHTVSSTRYSYYSILLPEGINAPTWRGVAEWSIMEDAYGLNLPGYDSGFTDNPPAGSFYDGYNQGYEAAGDSYQTGYDAGYSAGETNGKEEGYKAGYNDGLQAGGTGGGSELGPADDGATELYIELTSTLRRDVSLRFSQTVANGVSIDCGDGFAENIAGTGAVIASHTYAAAGNYKIRLLPSDGCVMGLGNGTYTVMGETASAANANGGNSYLVKVVVGKNVPTINNYAFRNCYTLQEAYLSDGVESLGGMCFATCVALRKVRLPATLEKLANNQIFHECFGLGDMDLPAGLVEIGSGVFGYNRAMKSLILKNVTKIGNTACTYCNSLEVVDLPACIQSIGGTAFQYCYRLQELHVRATIPPTLTAALVLSNTSCKIYIPAGTLEAYQAANYWKNHASKFEEE